MSWFSKKPAQPAQEAPALKPGRCECQHHRCSHTDGVGECHSAVTTDSDDKPLPKSEWGTCACQIFILDDDDDDGPDEPSEPVDPEIVELSRMVKL